MSTIFFMVSFLRSVKGMCPSPKTFRTWIGLERYVSKEIQVEGADKKEKPRLIYTNS
jgi:hypothetical protein